MLIDIGEDVLFPYVKRHIDLVRKNDPPERRFYRRNREKKEST